ncbi:unnamed protein product [Urochloa humidicola]
MVTTQGKELSRDDITIAAVGKIGNGKSATCNSIIGWDAFAEEYSYFRVTNTCQIKSTVFKDGRKINVIDTPGIRDENVTLTDSDISTCLNLANGGLSAVLVVLAATNRFSTEEHEIIKTIKLILGDKVVEHMIVVFTNGDFVDESKFEKMMQKAPIELKELVDQNGRIVLFNNRTKDRALRDQQLEKLIDLVDLVIAQNEGELFACKMHTATKDPGGMMNVAIAPSSITPRKDGRNLQSQYGIGLASILNESDDLQQFEACKLTWTSRGCWA